MRLRTLTTVKIYQLNTYNKVNLFNCKVTVIATIFRIVLPQYTTKQNLPGIIFSHLIQGIYFLIYVHNYKEIKGLNLGKIASLPNSENVINLHASFQSIAKKTRLLITRLICIK